MIKNLNQQEESALRDFLAKVVERFRDEYLYSLMYGSRARGDYRADSDLDVAVIVRHADFAMKREIRSLAYREFLETDVDISPVILSLDDYEAQKSVGFPIIREIERDKVRL